MSDPLQRAAQPQQQSTKKLPKRRRCRDRRDSCPSCGQSKIAKCKMCLECWQALKRSPLDETVYLDGGVPYRRVPLTHGHYAWVEMQDYDFLMQWKWHARWSPLGKCFYVSRSELIDGKHVTIQMHRVIMRAPKGLDVDHKIPGNTLDNRRSNLRIATRSQNCQNKRGLSKSSSRYKGVIRISDTRWRARIKWEKKNLEIGGFGSEKEAALAYNAKAVELYGEFACLNRID